MTAGNSSRKSRDAQPILLMSRARCSLDIICPHITDPVSPQFAVFETAWRFSGADLGGVPGIPADMLGPRISEVGTAEQLLAALVCPVAGLCPDSRISGGKAPSAKTRNVKSRLTGASRLGVFGLQIPKHPCEATRTG
jgi:hypothetical protein